MKNVLVTRFEASDLKFIAEYGRRNDLDKSAVIRELYKYGRRFLAVKRYEDRSASLGVASEIAGMSVGQFMDLLGDLKVSLNVSREDVLEGLNNLKQAKVGKDHT